MQIGLTRPHEHILRRLQEEGQPAAPHGTGGHENTPLMMAWNRLTGELQKVMMHLVNSPQQQQALQQWHDRGDLMMRRLAQVQEYPLGPNDRLGEATILGQPKPGVETAFASGIAGGDSTINGHVGSKDASELPHDDEETRELKIADTILRAAHGLGMSPAVEDIIRQAEELKRIHGVQ